jgi:hypothetical protein
MTDDTTELRAARVRVFVSSLVHELYGSKVKNDNCVCTNRQGTGAHVVS